MDGIFKRNDPTWIAHWINILTNRSRGGNGFLVAMGTSTTAGLIFPPKHFRRLHRILIVPAPKIRPYPTEIRVLFPSRKPRVSFTLSPIFFFFSPLFFLFISHTPGLMILPAARGEKNPILLSSLFITRKSSSRSKETWEQVFPFLLQLWYIMWRVLLRHVFYFSGNLELCEVNTPEKSSSFIFVNTRVDCQLNWNFYPLLFWQTYDGTM